MLDLHHAADQYVNKLWFKVTCYIEIHPTVPFSDFLFCPFLGHFQQKLLLSNHSIQCPESFWNCSLVSTPICTKAILSRIVIASLPSFDTNWPNSGQPAPALQLPSLAAFICCLSNLQRNVPHHQRSSLLSSLLYPLTRHVLSSCRDASSIFFTKHILDPVGGYQSFSFLLFFLRELLWKFPWRKDSVGIPFHGVMHNSSLCGGSQPCHSTDLKQIKETEENHKLSTPLPHSNPPTPRTGTWLGLLCSFR